MRRAVLLVLAASLTAGCGPGEPPGADSIYTSGEVRLNIAAGAERSEHTLDDLGEATLTPRGPFAFVVSDADVTLDVRIPVVDGPGVYTSNGARIALFVRGREHSSNQGGACTMQLATANRRAAEGSLACVGLGTIGGKGYDLGASFRFME